MHCGGHSWSFCSHISVHLDHSILFLASFIYSGGGIAIGEDLGQDNH